MYVNFLFWTYFIYSRINYDESGFSALNSGYNLTSSKNKYEVYISMVNNECVNINREYKKNVKRKSSNYHHYFVNTIMMHPFFLISKLECQLCHCT